MKPAHERMDDALAELSEGSGVGHYMDCATTSIEQAESCESIEDMVANLDEAQGYLAMVSIQIKAALKAAKGKTK